MVFTQFTDTMDFVREKLAEGGSLRVMCFSGRGGEVRERDGSWRVIPRDDVKQRFKKKEADVLVCSDAAAEGLNFQFCGALINYDMPWNPMRVEQRIGRIDRLGQAYKQLEIINLHYSDTVETDVYIALRKRIGLFETTVGHLQPILSQLPSLLAASVLKGRVRDAEGRAAVTSEIESQATAASSVGPDLNVIAEADAMDVSRQPPKLSLDDLELVISDPKLLPVGIEASGMRPGNMLIRCRA
jgi:superfamily II DNA/RNA helicase